MLRDREPLMSDKDFGLDELPDLHELLAELRTHGSVVPVKFWGNTIWLIMGHPEVKQAFGDVVSFDGGAFFMEYAAPAMGRNIQSMQGDEHRAKRALVAPSFMPGKVRALVEHTLEPIIHELLDRIEGKEEVEFTQAFTRPFPFSIITRMLGIPVHDEAKFLKWAVKLIDYGWDPEGSLQAKKEFDDYMDDIIRQRRAEPKDDMISMIVTAEVGGEHLSHEEILAFLRLLFPAGSDTTYKAGGSLFACVLADPAFRAMAQQDDKARTALVAEALRWQPPVALEPRMASADIELGGVSIKEGDMVALAITAANRDPAVFPDGSRFDPTRDNSKSLTFAYGPHFCLGMHLARRELEAALRIVFERFPNMQLSPDRPVEFVGGVLRGPRELWVRPYGAK
ncbi:cytochrome P450 [Sphingobium sp. Cam5-1]|uniref:cytochrome P450 n=1 Tax=Sphingobium sp. Cam5-1 TaxID=2789327 RepID=UPI001E5B32A1|nr:cytochrome P450 [Sphingobium sp. Cam5-1]